MQFVPVIDVLVFDLIQEPTETEQTGQYGRTGGCGEPEALAAHHLLDPRACSEFCRHVLEEQLCPPVSQVVRS